MASFVYKARNARGALISGELEATTLDTAADALLQRGYIPIDIQPGTDKPSTKGSGSDLRPAARRAAAARNAKGLNREFDLKELLQRKKIDLNELIIFSRQMQSLARSGIPLDRALQGLQASVQNPTFKSLLKDVQTGLESGQNLSTSLGRHPKTFSPLFLALVDVGENTGRLDLAFDQIRLYLELEKNTRKQVKGATRYPLFVVATMAVALAVITYFVIPAFSQTFARLGAELPLETRILIGISDFVVQWWQFLLGAVVAGVVGFRTWVRSRSGRLQWDYYKMKIPLAGRIFERIALSRFARTFSMIMKAGVPVVHGMGVVAGAVGNTYIGRRVLGMREGISRGESLYNTAVAADMFSPLVLQMISVGEESGNIDQLLEDVALFYDAEVEYDLKRLGEVIEPVLIMIIAGMVLILALGVFLPIWDLSSAVNNR